MATTESISHLLESYETKISKNDFTKSDVFYHNTKQTLHNMWAKLYPLETSEQRTLLTKKIMTCLEQLDRAAERNEQKKYEKYYSKQSEFSKQETERKSSFSITL